MTGEPDTRYRRKSSRPTEAWVERRCKTWADRLGLGHWTITVDWDQPTDEGKLATVYRSHDYDTARIILTSDWQKMTRSDLDQTIVHELLHLNVRDLSRAHDYLLEAVEDNTAATNIAIAAWKRAEEGCVDRLATALASAFGDAT